MKTKNKLLIAILLTITILFSIFTGCVSDSDKAKQKLDQAESAYDAASKQVNDLQSQINQNNSLIKEYEKDLSSSEN